MGTLYSHGYWDRLPEQDPSVEMQQDEAGPKSFQGVQVVIKQWLVGGLEHFFSYIGNNHPNWLSYFSEGFKPPTRWKKNEKTDYSNAVIVGCGWQLCFQKSPQERQAKALRKPPFEQNQLEFWIKEFRTHPQNIPQCVPKLRITFVWGSGNISQSNDLTTVTMMALQWYLIWTNVYRI